VDCAIFLSLSGCNYHRPVLYKHITIVNYNSSIVNKFRASFTDDTIVVIFDHYMFIAGGFGKTCFANACKCIYSVGKPSSCMAPFLRNGVRQVLRGLAPSSQTGSLLKTSRQTKLAGEII
jgi:hypothetical protein